MRSRSGVHQWRVLVVDDNMLFRTGLRSLLSTELGWDVVGGAEHGREALDLCRQLQPDLVLMDVSMPILGGIPATAAIKRTWPAIRVILMSADPDEAAQRAATDVGADGFVVKVVNAAEFLAAIQTLVEGWRAPEE